MSNSLDQFVDFYAKNRQEWHQWLNKNHILPMEYGSFIIRKPAINLELNTKKP